MRWALHPVAVGAAGGGARYTVEQMLRIVARQGGSRVPDVLRAAGEPCNFAHSFARLAARPAHLPATEFLQQILSQRSLLPLGLTRPGALNEYRLFSARGKSEDSPLISTRFLHLAFLSLGVWGGAFFPCWKGRYADQVSLAYGAYGLSVEM